MKRVVRYDNYMNELKFSNFTQVDLNFLMALCSLMKDRDTNEISFSFSELRKLTDYKKSNSSKEFAEDLEQMNDRLMKINCKLKTRTKTVMFVLFPTFEIDFEKQLLKVAVNPKFKFLLNEITKNFTKFELHEFISLSSKYSKNLYRLLKQFKATGRYEVSINDFRDKMDCPETYAGKYIMDKVIKPSIDELSNKTYFQGLKCIPQYGYKRGKPVTGYVFLFKPEKAKSEVHNCNIRETGTNGRQKKNRFLNLQNREYDYEELEKELLDRGTSRDDTDFEEEMLDSQSVYSDPELRKMIQDHEG